MYYNFTFFEIIWLKDKQNCQHHEREDFFFFFAHLGITNPQILSDVYKLNKYVE